MVFPVLMGTARSRFWLFVKAALGDARRMGALMGAPPPPKERTALVWISF